MNPLRRCLSLVILLGLMLFAGYVLVQDNSMIQAANVTQLGSVLQIDYATAPEGAGELVSGWLRMNPNASAVVTINRANDLLVWSLSDGSLLQSYSIVGGDGINANMLDVAWNADGNGIYSLHTDGVTYDVAVYDVASESLQVIAVPVGDDMPVRVWAGEDGHAWVEVMPADTTTVPYVLALDVDKGEVVQRLDSAPEQDSEAMVRIGRMPAPLAVTSTPEGTVRLWDLETGALLESLNVDGMPMFGHINGASGRHLAWRDPESAFLNMLDFDSGQNVQVASLDGAYLQAVLLTPSADVILGVNVDLSPVVVAWDVNSGDRVDLGTYRECNRTPDMVQISEDGTTLVIGCDTGLDVWRIEGAE